jgi:hypothetical protein
MSLKVGDKVEVLNTGNEAGEQPDGCWHSFPVGAIATVVGEIDEDGSADFECEGKPYTQYLRQDNFRVLGAAPKTTVKILKERPAGGKLLYAVVNGDGILEVEQDRDDARFLKAELGGLKNGVSIVQYAPVKEIR